MPDLKQRSKSKLSKRISFIDSSFKSLSSQLDSSKKKIAPRSSLQFKVGPQFEETISDLTIVDSKGKVIEPVLCPRIDRGFERLENEWVGYKRNYFTLVSSFFFKNASFNYFAREKLTALNPNTGCHTGIKYFGLRLVSKCADDGSIVCLVQHTAKRDRGPQFEPPIHPAVPSDLPNHDIIKEAANVRNTSKIAKLNKVFFFERDQYKNDEFDISGLKGYPSDKIIKVARYERIQFSSSINYKKPSSNSKRFKLSVELVGFIDRDEYLTLAHTETPPLIIRGRSPSNYNQSAAGIQKTSRLQTSTPTSTSNKRLASSSLKIALSTPNFETSSPNSVLAPKRENIEIQSVFDHPLDDFETFEILSNANRELSRFEDPSLCSSFNYSTVGKKKRGRKPKPPKEPKDKPVKEKNKKVKKRSVPKVKVPKSQKVKKIRDDNHRMALKELSPQNITNTPAISLVEVSVPPMDFEGGDDPKSPVSEVDILDNLDFDSSVVNVELHPDFKTPKASTYSSFVLTKSFTDFTNSENVDKEFMSMKNRCDMLEKTENEILESLSKFQSIPSEVILDEDYFRDGPSFIIY